MLRTILQRIIKSDYINYNKIPQHLRGLVKSLEYSIRMSMRQGLTLEEACEDWDIWLTEPYIKPIIRDWRTSVIDEWDDWEFLKQFFSEHPVKEIKILSNTST